MTSSNRYVVNDRFPERGTGLVLGEDDTKVTVRHLGIEYTDTSPHSTYIKKYMLSPLRDVVPTPLEELRLDKNRKKKRINDPVVQGGSLDKFVDFLRTVNTVLKIRCPQKGIVAAQSLYREIKGTDLDVERLDTNGSAGTWANMYYVFFPTPPASVELPTFLSQSRQTLGQPVKYLSTPTGYELDSRDLLVYLLAHGFDLGSNQPEDFDREVVEAERAARTNTP